MPIYEYQCTDCHHQFDLIQKFNDESPKTCPECSKNTLVRLVSAAGFQLKGTGWYATDFKDKGKPVKKTDATPSADKASEKSDSTPKAPDTAASSTTSKGETN